MQYGIILISGFIVPMLLPGASAVTQDVVHPGLRAISFAVNSTLFGLLGATMGPLIMGYLSDTYDLVVAFKILPSFQIIGSLFFIIGAFYYVRDLRKVKEVTLEEES